MTSSSYLVISFIFSHPSVESYGIDQLKQFFGIKCCFKHGTEMEINSYFFSLSLKLIELLLLVQYYYLQSWQQIIPG